MELKKYKLGDICSFNKNTISQDEDINIEYLETSNLIENKILSIQNVKLSKAPSRAQRKVKHNTILYSTVRPNLKHYGIMKMPSPTMIVSTGFTTIDVLEEYNESVDPFYLYLLITQEHITNYLHTIAENATSAYPSISSIDLENLYFDFPSLKEQKKISLLFSSIDQKIALNRVINHNLEAMAKQLYDYWFVQFDFPNEEGKPYKSSGGKMVWNEKLKREIPEGWHCGNLLEIATFTNGLACQKFRPLANDKGLPVIKIREMRSGFDNETEFVSSKISDSVKIFNGDVLFSWSASLEVILWSYGEGGLNQHIFKVTSTNNFPKSFFFYQLIGYISVFKQMAEARKTTMGHITQDHLQQSSIAIPNSIEIVNKLDVLIDPMFRQIIKNQEEISTLTKQRDELLPLLMNGQVSVNYDLSHD